MKKSILVILAVFSSLAVADVAADLKLIQTELDACTEKSNSNIDSKECMAEAVGKADNVLNAVYSQFKAKLAGDDDLAKKQSARLVNAQRDWIRFRDSNSKLFAYANIGSFQGDEMTQNLSIYNMTVARALELKEMMDNPQ